MKVYKFGGASVKNADGVRNLEKILRSHNPQERLVVVISAIGKTTNLLEQVLDAYYYDKFKLQELTATLRENHYTIVRELALADDSLVMNRLNEIFGLLDKVLSGPHSGNFDFDYDRIVSFGEILSTTLISSYLNAVGVRNEWADARLLIRTDHNYREGKVDWETSARLIQEKVGKILQGDEAHIVITQGFIGGTEEMLPTTLGREGSDYSAAIFAYVLGAESVTIWKDVPGLLNADPKFFPDAVKLEHIPYEEAIELAYYGASVIHPKTLKPLQNKQIPLYVKPFLHPEESGSRIDAGKMTEHIPCYIFKTNQVLISIYPKDFSFIAVENLDEIFSIISKNKIKINLMQNSALSFSICCDNKVHKIEKLITELSVKYKVKYNLDIELITIRHYTDDIVNKVIKNKDVLVEQRSRATVQLVTM
ncbi:MAG: aspartate kinase [Bacteroidales bacterium]|nr:aspartate kinase [Bacteroidales bacterium]